MSTRLQTILRLEFCVVPQPVQANSKIFHGVAAAVSLSILSSSSHIIMSHHFIVNNLCSQYIIIISLWSMKAQYSQAVKHM
jgi:hypothetical protein